MALAYTNILGGGSVEGRTEHGATGDVSYYYLKDHLGSTRMVLDESGVPVEATAFTAYGEQLPVLTSAASPVREKFTGKEHDGEGSVGVVEVSVRLTNVAGLGTSGENTVLIVEFDDNTRVEFGSQEFSCIGTTLELSDKAAYLPATSSVKRLTLIVTGVSTAVYYAFDATAEPSRTITPGGKLRMSLARDAGASPALPTSGIAARTPDYWDFAPVSGDWFAGIGLEYFGKRYLDAVVGRWVSVDPMP